MILERKPLLRAGARAIGLAGLVFGAGVGVFVLALVTEGCFLDIDCQVAPWRRSSSQALFDISWCTMFVAAPVLLVGMLAWSAVRLRRSHGREPETPS